MVAVTAARPARNGRCHGVGVTRHEGVNETGGQLGDHLGGEAHPAEAGPVGGEVAEAAVGGCRPSIGISPVRILVCIPEGNRVKPDRGQGCRRKGSCAELRVHSVSEVFGCPGRAEPDELILEDAQNGYACG
jgi:hypothetical protein